MAEPLLFFHLMPYDTVIIGAGMSGLAAGIRLAHYNQKVCILEQHYAVGGLNSLYRQRGRTLDVGLHALTNYVPKGTKSGPLSRLLRHLRLTWDELALVPQIGSAIAFPDVRLNFDNHFEVFVAEVEKYFPKQIDGLMKLVNRLLDYDQLGLSASGGSARSFVSQYITDGKLADMIFCPLLYYGGAKERDMEFGQFCVMFRSIFLEGFARPFDGVRLILKKLLNKFKMLGGELRLRCGVDRIFSKEERVERVKLQDGSEIEAKNVLSCAGWQETMQLCDLPAASEPRPVNAGQLGFIETISVLDKEPKSLGHNRTIIFFNDSDRFIYEKPQGLVDTHSGVICSPNNFDYAEPLDEGMIRITALANYDRWKNLPPEEYQAQKKHWYEKTLASAVRFMPDFRKNIIDMDMFTPTTIRRFTGRENGAIYGAPEKKYDGRTHLENLYVCGTDQGMVGIIGAIVSGITIANRYLLAE
ncbi:MAG: NAD(P)/FAD-dependent oxidoreductase [Planctomycetaceae bacterium]|jgi:phytoene dehydrogenase-like protein|nr:NAD(P)/FAD-dependent oxidoreductase [Planctomycetaceae bacterium]